MTDTAVWTLSMLWLRLLLSMLRLLCSEVSVTEVITEELRLLRCSGGDSGVVTEPG